MTRLIAAVPAFLRLQAGDTVVCQQLFVELSGEEARNLGILSLRAFAVRTPRNPTPYLPELAGSHFEDH